MQILQRLGYKTKERFLHDLINSTVISILIITTLAFILNFSKFGIQMQMNFGILNPHYYSVLISGLAFLFFEHKYQFGAIPILGLYFSLNELIETPGIIANDSFHYLQFITSANGAIRQSIIILVFVMSIYFLRKNRFSFKPKYIVMAFYIYDFFMTFWIIRYNPFVYSIAQVTGQLMVQEYSYEIIATLIFMSTFKMKLGLYGDNDGNYGIR